MATGRLIFVLLLAALPAVGQDYPRYRAVGSTYVPLDSWVYPAFERLAAQGYVPTAMLALKPWTRFECARLTDEAREGAHARLRADERVHETAVQAIGALENEFAHELDLLGGGSNRSLRLESVYARATSISGAPLTDGFHFGQTVSNDYGRPFRRGTNVVAGAALSAAKGPFAVYVQGEYQHAPSAPAVSDQVADLIASVDRTTRQAPRPFGAVNRGRLVDAYVAVNIRNYQISFGQQSISWAVGEGESLLLSRNAEPFPMLRLASVVPHKFPWLMKHLGPTRSEFFVGRLDGQIFVPRPFIYGMKTAFKPHPRVELAFGRTTLLGGGNFAITWKTLFDSFIGNGDELMGTRPGDSRVAFDMHWAVPGLGDSVSFYWELFQDDDEFYFIQPGRGALRVGIYVARVPRVPKLDFRVEGASTESPIDFPIRPIGSGLLNYWNFQYLDGYRHNGFLMGNTVGRAGRTMRFWSTYWFSPRNSLQIHFKHQNVLSSFIPGGGTWQDYGARHEIHMQKGVFFRNSLQFEHISKFPALFNGPRNNITAAVMIGFSPLERKN